MDDQQRARELLAAEIDRDGFHKAAAWIRDPKKATTYAEDEALRAITAALRAAPEGFVLVPGEVLRMMVGCAYPVSTEIDPRGYRWSEAYLDEARPHMQAALAAARPQESEE
ncbi:hypothetical protein [Stenotrophomonas sp. SY1]|uniref:hypothetical protein n=1 Tax=Stenotrophomonas sp. SY1 TaxID=477235 RepID=UPI001E5E4091|nr:hypothetical protein [Stenotrophomonas sp. SY1]MCD9087395.1 hypothetical protein [Stenotrophomonas sp. SY1]